MPTRLTRYQLGILKAVARGEVRKWNGSVVWWIKDPSRDSGYRNVLPVMDRLEHAGFVKRGEPESTRTWAFLTDAGRIALGLPADAGEQAEPTADGAAPASGGEQA